jgi:protein phosphatase
MTLDDDLATREVRLNGILYRQALGMSSSGSLFQALGMNSSTALHPNIRRMIVDEECIFLLCSDGISDRDRVDQYWQTEILPVLEGKVDLATACQRTINMANTHNGHDNSTVALVHCQVKQPVEAGQNTASEFPTDLATAALAHSDTLLLANPETSGSIDRQRVRTIGEKNSNSNNKKPLLLGAIGLVLLISIGAGGWVLTQGKPSVPASTSAPR